MNTEQKPVTKKYTFINLIGNQIFLKKLIEQKHISPSPDYGTIWNTMSGSDSIISEDMMDNKTYISEGGFNKVYKLNDKKIVFRSTILPVYSKKLQWSEDIDIFKLINSTGKNELKGLFIQWFLSKTCTNKINDVIEFGIYIDHSNKDNVYVYALLEEFEQTLNDFFIVKPYGSPYKNDVKIITIYHKIFNEIAVGLKCMHDLNYYHLDIKLENIGLIKQMEVNDNDTTYRAVICDFGFTTYIPDTDKCINKMTGTILYYDPYLYTYETICKKGDDYSFGMLIYEICGYTNKNKDSFLYNPFYKDIRKYVLDLIYPYKIEDLQQIIEKYDEQIKITDQDILQFKNTNTVFIEKQFEKYKNQIQHEHEINQMVEIPETNPEEIKKRIMENKIKTEKKEKDLKELFSKIEQKTFNDIFSKAKSALSSATNAFVNSISKNNTQNNSISEPNRNTQSNDNYVRKTEPRKIPTELIPIHQIKSFTPTIGGKKSKKRKNKRSKRIRTKKTRYSTHIKTNAKYN